MEYRNLGRSGLKVSPISLGTNAFGGRADEATSIAVVHKALDSGINLIDTADTYMGGESERIIGLALQGRRTQAVLATKGWFPMGEGPNDRGLSRKHILDAVDASLRRLQTDYIDLYQMHNWDPETPLEETLETLNDLVGSGKVRYIGCSNFAGWQFVKALGISERRGWARFISNQPEYSPANRKIERDVIPAGIAEGVGQIVYFPLAGGLFTGKYKRNEAPPEDSRAITQGERFKNRWMTDRNFTLVERMTEIAAEAGISLPHLAIAWAMAKPGITSAIVGASKVAQLADNIGACEAKLTPEVIKRVDEVSADFV
ncbi:MAG: oxidoreductase [Firmicutes bacterium]|nr:oxidoreductase [Bacillota bacterium]